MAVLYIASDHAGVELKDFILDWVFESGLVDKFDIIYDCGTHGTNSVDYPDFANVLCSKVLDGADNQGILICGTGIGMSIAANKWSGIRCALVNSEDTAILARQHNNANVISIGARVVDTDMVKPIVTAFLSTDYEGGRHDVRLAKLKENT